MDIQTARHLSFVSTTERSSVHIYTLYLRSLGNHFINHERATGFIHTLWYYIQYIIKLIFNMCIILRFLRF